MSIYSASGMLAEKGLVVLEDYENKQLLIARPFGLVGADFEEWSDGLCAVSGIGNMVIKINAPFAKISQASKKKWLAEIEVADCGPSDRAWLHKKCSSPKEAAQAVIDCYFQQEMVTLKTIDDA